MKTDRARSAESSKLSRIVASLLVALGCCLAVPGLGQPVFLPAFQVDAYGSGLFGDSHAEAAVMGEDGSFGVAWLSGGDVFARRFSAQESPLNGFSLGSSYIGADRSSMARDASGRIVVVWKDGNWNVSGRRFASNGTPLEGTFVVTASELVTVAGPRVACDPSGNFVVTWTSHGSEGSKVVARRFDRSGSPLGYEFVVNASTQGLRESAGIGMSEAGFVVTWNAIEPSGNGVFGRGFRASGEPLTGDFQVVNTGAAFPGPSDVAMTARGDIVVVWSQGSATLARRFDNAGSPRGDVFPVGTPVSDQPRPQVASDSSGNFLVVWNSPASIVGRAFDASGNPAGAEFQVAESPSPGGYLVSRDPHPAIADDGSFVVAWTDLFSDYYGNRGQSVSARKSGVRASSGIEVGLSALRSDSSAPGVNDVNDVLEPGETVVVASAWENLTSSSAAISGTAPFFTGPAGATYTLVDATADYGIVGAHQRASCFSVGNCYEVAVSAPAVRPIQHWDSQLQENLNIGVPKTWTLHIGESFPDVPTSHEFYTFVETVFHNGVTAGCADGGYCPEDPVTRAQMAVFLLKSRFGAAHVPPPCTGAVFSDVHCAGGPFDPWIEELAGLQITGGCGGGLYCPNDTVTRQQMAVLLLKTRDGSAYDPPDCAGIFADVPCTPGAGFSDWIEELSNRGITGGCSGVPHLYCPTNPSNRGQMAALLSKTFGLVLYGGR